MADINTIEEWRDIEGLEYYQISSIGNIKSLDRVTFWNNRNPLTTKGRVLSSMVDNKGYCRITIKKHSRKIHRMVSIAFIPNPENLSEVNHKNGIKTDNRVENLEWCSHLENMKHCVRTGLLKPLKGENHGMAKVTNKQVIEIRELHKQGQSAASIAREYSINEWIAQRIVNKQSWKHIA